MLGRLHRACTVRCAILTLKTSKQAVSSPTDNQAFRRIYDASLKSPSSCPVIRFCLTAYGKLVFMRPKKPNQQEAVQFILSLLWVKLASS